MIINKEKIKELIPHRPPFLFVDSCEIITPGEHGISYRFFKEDEYFFEGHFPSNPIVPGVIIIEAMAQTAGIVVSYQLREYKEKSVLFMIFGIMVTALHHTLSFLPAHLSRKL